MPTLERIEIEGFKSIKEMVLDLRPINVLIGANGAGKSNFISVFTLLQRMREGRLQQHVAQAGGADSLLHYGRKRTPQLRLKLAFSEQQAAFQFELTPSDDDSFIITNDAFTSPHSLGSEALVFATNQRSRREATWSLKHESSLQEFFTKQEPQADPDLREAIAELRLVLAQIGNAFNGLKVYHFQDTSPNARIKQTQDLNDNAALRADASNLAAFLYLLQKKHLDSYRRIVATVRLAAPYFDDFRLRTNPFNEQKILLEWSERDSDDYFNAHALSDGTLRFICLATLLLQPELPAMIIIDEPELGLHPYAIQLLAGMVRSASQKSQIILSTQSVTLVNQFTPEDLVIVDRQDRASTFHRPTAEEIASWLESYSLGELWEKNVLGGRPG
ncbi:DUF2813 domain-containing protein [Corallococcus sp. AB004]|uniref:AAA family ATPase n=1 Tax=Corallococcus exiguus TaxID=83462 RepID=UPI000EA0D3AF|nr:AAA family ATPase [Corallococcus exiguus]NRD45120.1 AAA family ATPase [Corallococcus exiguus]RKI45485.1 DUF2813 domain-containing protein [Corallococcus sp. AB004]